MRFFSNLKDDKRLFRQLDFPIIIVVTILCLFSLANIYSSTHVLYKSFFITHQIEGIIISLIAFCFILLIDYRVIANYAKILYWVSIILLMYTLVGGKVVNGARAWIDFKIFQLEPSEVVKLTLAILFAKVINDMEENIHNKKNLISLMLYALLPLMLILKQPALGMALICFVIALSILFAGGIDLRLFLLGLVTLIAIAAVLWNTNLVKQYQKDRFTAFLNPTDDTLGQGYQLDQSLTAIGSGGIDGKGYLKGTQINNGTVPESSTDFIFAVIGEEWGLIGEIFLLLLYGIIAIRIVMIAKMARDKLGALICVGVFSSFILNVFINIGMTIGIMPITGVTLPYISYGGSSLLCNFMSIALVLNVGIRNKSGLFT